jgi:5S rRNA maturation endonuclease (ribonuclease M5)
LVDSGFSLKTAVKATPRWRWPAQGNALADMAICQHACYLPPRGGLLSFRTFNLPAVTSAGRRIPLETDMQQGVSRSFLRTVACAGLLCAAGAGCALWRGGARPVDLPDKYSVVLDQLVVHTNFPLPSQHRLLQEINAERLDVSNRLNLPVSDETINVYLFKDADQFGEFIRQKYPYFPDRRAFFVETDTRLAVYAQWGDRTAEDLRHEVCHGYLHSVMQNLPLWLDEGIAEYFEVPRGTHGLNVPHVKELNELAKNGKWQPNIERLEAFRSPAAMTEDDYAESWAWVHWLLETEPIRRTLLQEYLTDLRRSGGTVPLSQYVRRLGGDPPRELFEYVRWLSGKTGQ